MFTSSVANVDPLLQLTFNLFVSYFVMVKFCILEFHGGLLRHLSFLLNWLQVLWNLLEEMELMYDFLIYWLIAISKGTLSLCIFIAFP